MIKCWLKNDLKWLSFSHFCHSLCPHSHDYSFIVSGSEDKYIYIWSTYHDLSKFTSVRRDRNDFWEGIKGDNALCVQGRMTFNLLKSKLSFFFILTAHNAVVTSAVFAPHPSLIVPQEAGAEKPEADSKSLDSTDSETIPSGRHCFLQSWTLLLLLETVVYFLSGALKTDHTEVLLSADFTGAIKVFINVKKYWALQSSSKTSCWIKSTCQESMIIFLSIGYCSKKMDGRDSFI